MLLSDFNALGPIIMGRLLPWHWPSFFHADTVASVHLLSISWYLISLFCVYLCSCMHMSILCSTADAVNSGSWPILFKVLMLNASICIVCLHFSSFCCLSSVADFSNTEARAPATAGRAPFLPVWRAMQFMYVVWVWVMVIFRFLFLFSIHRSHSYRWAAVVPWSNWRSWALSLETHSSRTRLGIAFGRQRVYLHTFTSIMLLPKCT